MGSNARSREQPETGIILPLAQANRGFGPEIFPCIVLAPSPPCGVVNVDGSDAPPAEERINTRARLAHSARQLRPSGPRRKVLYRCSDDPPLDGASLMSSMRRSRAVIRAMACWIVCPSLPSSLASSDISLFNSWSSVWRDG